MSRLGPALKEFSSNPSQYVYPTNIPNSINIVNNNDITNLAGKANSNNWRSHFGFGSKNKEDIPVVSEKVEDRRIKVRDNIFKVCEIIVNTLHESIQQLPAPISILIAVLRDMTIGLAKIL